jgi:hypothetical protein
MSQTARLFRLWVESHKSGIRKAMIVRVFVAGGTGVTGRRLVPSSSVFAHPPSPMPFQARRNSARRRATRRSPRLALSTLTSFRTSADAIRHVEEVVVKAGGAALRYGALYGPGADDQVEFVRKRQIPLVGGGDPQTIARCHDEFE